MLMARSALERRNRDAERRRFTRVPSPVCTWLSFRSDRAAYGTLSMDLGVEGARFALIRPVEVGDQVLVDLLLPSGTIECKGRVCWSGESEPEKSCFGVRFLDLREAEREYLTRHLSNTTLS